MHYWGIVALKKVRDSSTESNLNKASPTYTKITGALLRCHPHAYMPSVDIIV